MKIGGKEVERTEIVYTMIDIYDLTDEDLMKKGFKNIAMYGITANSVKMSAISTNEYKKIIETNKKEEKNG